MANSKPKNFWNSGECLVWASSLSLTTILLLISTLFGVVLINSLDALWTKPIAKVAFCDVFYVYPFEVEAVEITVADLELNAVNTFGFFFLVLGNFSKE